MRIEKHKEILKEVDATIEEALNDKNGILNHQRRIASMTSIGMQQLIEIYFHKLNIIKPGAQVKHEWFKMEDKKLRLKLSAVLTTNFSQIPEIAEINAIAYKIETDRNDLIYGAPLKDGKKLREKIDDFLDLKNIIEMGGD